MRIRGGKGNENVSGRTAFAVVLASLAFAAMAIAPAGVIAAPPGFWQSATGDIGTARGVAADPGGGHVFVSDQGGVRIVEFTAWGALVKIWGWDVVASGPGDTAPINQLEVCVPAEGDICKAGIAGPSNAGQFNSAAGLAVDSSGNLYAAEAGTPRRVQKFSPEGQFLLSFGGGVNQGGGTPENPGNVCTATHIANGDICGAGKTGTGPSEFSGSTGSLRTVIAIAPDDKVWVGDKERVQRFNTQGVYQGEIVPENPDDPGVPPTTQQLAVDAAGFLYASYEAATNEAKEDVYKLDPATGAVLLIFEAVNPRGIAVAANGDVYVFDKAIAKIRHFDATGKEVEPPFGEDLASNATGLAASTACGIPGVDVYFSNTSPSFVRAYGPPPDPDLCPQPQVSPQIASQYAASVGTDSAAVEAQINPSFWDDATYYVEYGTTDCTIGPCQQVLFPGAPLTSELANEPLTASADLTGLEPDTTYHFRFVTESGGGGPVIGPDTTFTTYRIPAPIIGCANQNPRSGTAAALPDCRAYEMVSPVEKNGGDVDAYFYEGLDADLAQFKGLDQGTPDGAKLAYTAASAFADPEGSPSFSEYIATRTVGGWATESIDPPMRGGIANHIINTDSQFKAFSEDLCQGWLKTESGLRLAPGPTEGFQNLYRRENCTAPSTFTWLESSAPEPEPCTDSECDLPYLNPELQDFTVDGDCAVFRVNDALTPDATTGVQGDIGLTTLQTYLWCQGTGVRLVSVLPDGTPFAGNSSGGTAYVSIGAASYAKGRTSMVENALSEDGTRVYWTATDPLFEVGGPGALRLRVNADQPQSAVVAGKCTEPSKACTVSVSPNLNAAQFWTANPEGSKAIYSILIGAQAGNLSEFNFNEAEGKGASTVIAGQTLGVAGANEDATRIYFASREVCSGAKENSSGDVAEAGKANLYLYETGESCEAGELDFIGALAEGDVSTGGAGSDFPSPLASVPRDHIARATPDGEHLTFVSAAPLTAYDNADQASGKADREVYLYDAGSGELTCASCNPSGARPAGADLGREIPLWTAAWIPGYQHQLYGRRLISEDGNRLFFNSVDALSLRDINGAQDVYQWEAPGTGDCKESSSTFSPKNGGCIDLISSGQSPADSEWVEASANGEDVFFRTESSLVGSDPGSIDIYDARVGGGFPEPTPKAACEGDSCQAPPPAPSFQTPSSEAFEGPGNAKPKKPRCAKGKVRRKGRCVKRKGKGKGAQRRAGNNRRAAR